MKALRLLFGIVAFLAAGAALAIDPGVAQGWLQIDGGAVSKLTHAYVYQERPQEMRILVVDRELTGDALPRIAPSSVGRMALDGKLRGVLIQLDPDRPRNALITPLSTTAAKGKSGTVRNLSIANNRVLGEVESYPGDVFEFAYRAKFSAPLFTGYRIVPGGSVKQ